MRIPIGKVLSAHGHGLEGLEGLGAPGLAVNARSCSFQNPAGTARHSSMCGGVTPSLSVRRQGRAGTAVIAVYHSSLGRLYGFELPERGWKGSPGSEGGAAPSGGTRGGHGCARSRGMPTTGTGCWGSRRWIRPQRGGGEGRKKKRKRKRALVPEMERLRSGGSSEERPGRAGPGWGRGGKRLRPCPRLGELLGAAGRGQRGSSGPTGDTGHPNVPWRNLPWSQEEEPGVAERKTGRGARGIT